MKKFWCYPVRLASMIAAFVTLLMPAWPSAEGFREQEAATAVRQAQAQGAEPRSQAFQLTLESIARIPRRWMGSAPSAVQWAEDSRLIYFNWNPELKDQPEMYVMAAAGGAPAKVPDEERRLVPGPGAERTRESTLVVYQKFGDIFLHNVRTRKTLRITDTEAAESNPHFTFDGTGITFERDQNLFLWTIASGELRQVTNFKTGKDPEAKPKLTKMQEYLEKQQLDLFDILKKQDQDERERKSRDKVQRGPHPEPTYLKDTERIDQLQLSGDGKVVTFILTDRAEFEKTKFVEMPKYVTKTGFVEMQKLEGFAAVKAGDPSVRTRLGIVSTETGKIVWAEHGQESRAINFNRTLWSNDGKRAAMWVGSIDHKDMWLVRVDLQNGSVKTLAHLRDDAWIEGPRDGLGLVPSGWMTDNRLIWYLSEQDGFRHLYVVSSDGGEPRQMTRGNYEISNVRLSRNGSRWYYISTEAHPGERQLYMLLTVGGAATRLTPRTGWYDYYLSPDEKQIALVYGNANTPSELYVMPALGAGVAPAEPKRLMLSTTEEFRSYPWRAPEIVTFKDADGFDIYADLWEPKVPHPLRPAVIYVHGGGYSQAVYRRWSDESMFFHFLTGHGYFVLNIDYRGSSGYGRDCRTAIYRAMGEKDVMSSIAGVEYLVTQQKIDRRRIGIYGGSYGGFYTLMALFKHPGVFAAGAALYPVTDWAHYDRSYTARILNFPYDDDEAYRRSSPIYFADGLRDWLLILHGVQDTNVHFQDSVRLAQRFIELKKINWELALYPIENHGWLQETSRLDSYRRIFALFEQTLKATKPPAEKTSVGPNRDSNP